MLAPLLGALQATLSSWGPGRPRLLCFVSLARSVGCALGFSFRDLDGFSGDGRGFCPVIKMSHHVGAQFSGEILEP